MKLTTGIDLLEIKRMEQSLQHPRFYTRGFSDAEREMFEQKGRRTESIAANFCAKEAFSKALGAGVRGFGLNEVSVLRDSLGAPYFVFEGRAGELVKQRKLTFSVSLTHTAEYAAAFVVAMEG